MDDRLDEVKTLLREATAILNEIRREVKPEEDTKWIDHGTKRGYEQHLREDVTPCAECRAANAEHQKEKRRRKREADALL